MPQDGGAQSEKTSLAELRRQRLALRAATTTGTSRVEHQRQGHCADRSPQDPKWKISLDPWPQLDYTYIEQVSWRADRTSTMLADSVSVYKESALAFNNQKKTKQRYANIWKLNSTLLTTTWVKKRNHEGQGNISNNYNAKAVCQKF